MDPTGFNFRNYGTFGNFGATEPQAVIPPTPTFGENHGPQTDPLGPAHEDYLARTPFGKAFHNRSDDSINMNTVGTGFKALGTIASAWLGMQTNRLAKENLNFQRDAFQKNYANSVNAYNESLDSRYAAREARNGSDNFNADAQWKKYRLGETQKG